MHFSYLKAFLFHFAVRRTGREPSLFMGVSPDKQDNIYSEFNSTEKILRRNIQNVKTANDV